MPHRSLPAFFNSTLGRLLIAVVIIVILIAIYFFVFKASDTGGADFQPRPVSVSVAQAEQGEIAFAFEGVGSLMANESITVTAKESGIVETIHFEEGQRVEKDQLLLSMNANELRAELEVAQAQRDQVQLEADRAKRLLKSKSISQEQADSSFAQLRAANARVSAAQARLKEIVIHAPFAGVVGLRNVSPGALISPGTAITTLDDIETMKLDFTVPEVYVSYLKTGMPLSAKTAAYKGQEFLGEISAIDTRLDTLTRSIKVQGKIKNPEKLLKPGFFMNVLLALDKRDQAITIPEEALISKGLKQYVFVVREGKAVNQEVEIGFRQPGLVEILSGVAAGESVVISGLQKLRSDAAVVIADSQPAATTSK